MTTKAAAGPIKTGRPRAPTNHGKPRFYEGKLYDLLLKTFAEYVEDGRLNVGKLSENLVKPNGQTGMHKFTVYKWLQEDRIPKASSAESLVKLSEGRLTVEKLVPFLFN